MLPGVLPVVDRHYVEMRELEAIVLRLTGRAWATVDPDDIFDSWDAALARLLPAFVELQLAAATAGGGYGAATLAAQGIQADAEAEFVPRSLVGWASDGRPLESLLMTPLDVTFERLTAGLDTGAALESGRHSLERIARTQITDAGRVAAGVDIVTRPRVGWVRMLNGSSCSRCVTLAGRVYQWSDGFDRHPQDDCIHVPTTINLGRYDVLTDPRKFFDSLSREEQDKRFTKAGAQAIRDGADIGQVVNARRGMSTTARDEFGNRIGRMAPTSVFGQDVFTTLEGTTTRGLAGQRLLDEGARLSGESAETVRRRSRGGDVARTVTRQRVQIPRLMPEAIYDLAKDRADALRLLKRFGYVI